jgi:hypothetical protein
MGLLVGDALIRRGIMSNNIEQMIEGGAVVLTVAA